MEFILVLILKVHAILGNVCLYIFLYIKVFETKTTTTKNQGTPPGFPTSSDCSHSSRSSYTLRC